MFCIKVITFFFVLVLCFSGEFVCLKMSYRNFRKNKFYLTIYLFLSIYIQYIMFLDNLTYIFLCGIYMSDCGGRLLV